MRLEKPTGLQVLYGLIERDLHRECDSKPISAASVPELTLNRHESVPRFSWMAISASFTFMSSAE